MGSSGKAINIRKTEGQSTLEFAMVVPIVIILILAASQIGITVYSRMQLQQAAREAARIMSTTGNKRLAAETVRSICGEDAEIIIEPGNPSQRRLGDIITVTVSSRTGGFSDIVKLIMGKELILTGEAKMRMECGQGDL